VREELEARLIEAVERGVCELSPDGPAPDLSGITLVPARGPGHGDYACNAALIRAKPLGQPPRAIAERIAAALEAPEVERVEIAGPGFLNLYLAQERWHDVISRALREGPAWGRSDSGAGQTVQVEFVSANPTGPLTIGHGRNAVLGDAVARLLEAIGYKVTREYYFNDGGRQMRVLGQSVKARYLEQLGQAAAPSEAALDDPENSWVDSISGLPVVFPKDGYRGEYLSEIAAELRVGQGDALIDEAAEGPFLAAAKKAIFAEIRATEGTPYGNTFVLDHDDSVWSAGLFDEIAELLLRRLSSAAPGCDPDEPRSPRQTGTRS